jgi:hypothetical protein
MMIWRFAQYTNVKKTMDYWGYEYNKDWVHLGIIPGWDTGLYVFAQNPYVGEVDNYGTPLKDIEVMNGFNDINDVDLWVKGDWNFMPEVRQISSPYGTPFIFVGHPGAAVSCPIWVDNGQMTGFVHGWPGAAMYESLVGKPGLAAFGSMTISVAYLILLVSTLVGNVLYIIKRYGGN